MDTSKPPAPENDAVSPSGGVVRATWDTSTPMPEVDEDCSPTKVCKNMRGITFDGFAEPGSDLGTAWRALLGREGKLNGSAQSIRDLVIGPPETR